MPLSYSELVAQAKREIREISVDDLASRSGAPPLIVDVREPQEFAAGTIAGAVLMPRGVLAGTIVRVAPDPATDIVLLCSHGNRSALAAKELQDLGYRAVASLAGGFAAWRASGRDGVLPIDGAAARYARHLVLPGVGAAGQRRLGAARVLVVGAGGLGSPAALYLAAAGVGTLGIVDDDAVDISNLQRQVLHTTESVGTLKVVSAARTLAALNPEVALVAHSQRLDASTVEAILTGYDIVVDGSDNFPTRYLLNDAALRLRLPLVHGSVFRWEGQCTVIDPYRGPCYRCLFPHPPPPDLAPDCAEAGVFGAVAGVIGSVMAIEVAKLILGLGEPLVGRLTVFDGLRARTDDLAVRRDPNCPACRDEGRPPALIDYDVTCMPR